MDLTSTVLRYLLSSGAPSAGSTYCLDKNVTYAHRVDNPEGWNWCLVPDGGYDAVFFAAVAIAVMCLASPRWDALVVLFFGGIYFTFANGWNLEHASNAVMLWLGMRPADIFVYVFLPPFLLDTSVRIDFFMLKKVAFNIAFMAFVMVAASALLLIPFMLYALDLKSSGWTAGYVALFGAMIASTDAASVSAVLRGGGGPEILSVLLEGESLFNDASSLTLFEVFKEIVTSDEETSSLGHDIQKIVVLTIWSAFTGICIGLAMGIFTRWIYAWLQYRNMEAMAEVSWSVAGAYLSFYITQVWCKGSGCIGAVAFGLYGSSTLLWGMSTKARLSGIFSQFWKVLTFIVNGLIFFYVGASSINFTIRSAKYIFNDSRTELVLILLYKLPLIYLASFTLRFILIFVSFKFFQYVRLSEGLAIQEVIFVTVGGLRGSLSLVLAQSAATLATSHTDEETTRVKAEIAIYTAGYVIMTLLINAPLCGPLLTLLGLDRVRQEQLAMRGEVKNLFHKFTATAIEDLAAGQDEDELLQGLDWAMVKQYTDFDKQLDKELPEVQPRVRWFHNVCTTYWWFVTTPARLWRSFTARSSDSSAADALDMEAKAAEVATRQKQEADLKRATNINLRDLQRAESRAPTASQATSGLGSPAGSRPPATLIIRDSTMTTAHSTSGGRSLASPASASTAGASSGSRRQPLPMSNSLRRSNSRRVSAMVVSAPSNGMAPTSALYAGSPGPDGPPDRSFRRGNSRFLEGAVAGPMPVRAATPPGSALATPPGGLSKASSVARRLDSVPNSRAGAIGDDETDSVIQLRPPPQSGVLRRGSAPGESADMGRRDSAGGLLDPALVQLAGASVDAEAGVSAAAAPQVSIAVSPEEPAEAVPPNPFAAGGDSLIELAAEAAAGTTASAADVDDAVPVERLSPASAAIAAASGRQPSQARLMGIGSAGVLPRLPSTARPSPLSRGGTGGTSIGNAPGVGAQASATLSRFHASASTGSLQDAGRITPKASGNGAVRTSRAGARVSEQGEPEAKAGTVLEPEPAKSPTPGTGPGERGLLQSLLVIKPGASTGRPAGMTPHLQASTSVRLVQRLGNDNRGSALEALRTDAAAAGSRGLGRGSVRAAGPAATAHTEQLSQQPPVVEAEVGSLIGAWGDRPLNRTSLSAPNAGRPLGGTFLPNPDNCSGASESRAVGKFEFALPDDVNPTASIIDPFFGYKGGDDGAGGAPARGSTRAPGEGGLARGSVHQGAAGEAGLPTWGSMRATAGAADAAAGAGAGSGLARSSFRQNAAAGGGALARASIRLGRQAGLAAASAQLARIYDTDLAASSSGREGHPAIPDRGDVSPINRPAGLFDQGLALAQRLSTAGPAGQERVLHSPSRALVQAGSAGGRQSEKATENGPVGAGGTNQHIAAQVSSIQQREAAAAAAAGKAASGPQGASQGGSSHAQHHHHHQYSLGSMSKGALMSLIRRSANPANGGGGSTAEASGRGFEGLARRTRFADANAATALARASASGTLMQQNSADVEGASSGVCAPLLVEYRLRLLAGLKQYYRAKHAAGSLSPTSYKVLSYVADQSAHHPEQPLSLWSMVRQEVSNGWLLHAEATAYFRLKNWTGRAKASENKLIRAIVPRLLVPFVWTLSLHISATTLAGLETAVELWASLTQSLQTEWLQYSGLYGELLLEEVQHEADGAWAYIIERRIEAPNKFGAVQTHRAVIDVLTQQQAFVKEMNEGGMIDESECRKIVETVEKRLQLLARRGPRWRQPTVTEILEGTAILRGLPSKVVDWIRKNSTFRVYQQGAAIWDLGRKRAGEEPDGLIIVIRGVVRMMLEQDGALIPYYLGAGGVGGLVSCVLESHVPGMSSAAAYAEGNALGKGPVVMHIPWRVLQVLRNLSRVERMAPFQALDLQLYRTAAVYVLDLLRHQVTQQFSAFIRSSLLTILRSERLDGPTVRRQRIRLLLQPAASDHHVDGAIDWIGELLDLDPDMARQLLDPTASPFNGAPGPTSTNAAPAAAGPISPFAGVHNGSARNHHGGSQALMASHGVSTAAAVMQRLAAAPWVEVMYKAIAAATGAVLDVIRTSLKDSILVVLVPGQGIVQRTTMVLIQGSLEPAPVRAADGTGGASNAGGPFVASSNETHVAPSVMVWVSDYFEGELVAQKEVEVVAGPRGATLLMWGVLPEDLLLPSPSAPAPSGPADGKLPVAPLPLTVVPEGRPAVPPALLLPDANGDAADGEMAKEGDVAAKIQEEWRSAAGAALSIELAGNGQAAVEKRERGGV